MRHPACEQCNSTHLKVKKIELRRINTHTMKTMGTQTHFESECLSCGSVFFVEAEVAALV